MNQSITSRKNHSDTSSNETYFNYFDYASEEEVKELYKRYDNNQAVSDEVYWILIVAYSILIVVGCIGNLGVIIAVAGNKKMKTARNIFIATLAVADSTLCVLTMPMTLLGVLTKYWPFGTETEVLCTIVRTWPAINAFFSSYTMAVIAFDRHRFIVHSTKRQANEKEAIWISVGVFGFSCGISIPFIIFTRLQRMFYEPGAYDHIAFCVEDLSQQAQAWMSICVIVVQYCVPCALVTFYYISICRFLASRPILASNERQKQILAKRRKNNRMLIAVTVAHFTSWLPLNMINIILTMFDSDESPLFTNVEHLYIAYAMCHLASMTSAISNPVLYGFMNENFRVEFDKIWQRFSKCKKVEETHNANTEAAIENGTQDTSRRLRRQGSENITMVELKTEQPTEV